LFIELEIKYIFKKTIIFIFVLEKFLNFIKEKK